MSKFKDEVTWNPTTGCTNISTGCSKCYAKCFAEQFRGIKGHSYEQGLTFKMHEDRLLQPYRWKEPRNVYINSMGDLFYDEVPDEFILKVFKVIQDTPQHTYRLLTRRAERMSQWFRKYCMGDYYGNLCVGVAVENEDTADNIFCLNDIDALIKYVSFEPLIEAIDPIVLTLADLNWVIVSGETGSGARQMKKKWVDSLYEESRHQGIPFYFKQWGEFNEKGLKVGRNKAGKLYNGQLIQEKPY